MPVRITPAGAPALCRSRMSLDRMIEDEVEAVRRAVLDIAYPPDPILGTMSRVSSMSAALVRRHGILSATILARAVDVLSEGRLEVLPEYPIPLTRIASDLVRANARARVDRIDLPAEGAWTETTYRADFVVVCEELGVAWIVEVKRANASYARKLRRPLQQLEIARLSASSILRGAYRISRVETVLVSLYGDASSDDVLDRRNVDAFFGLEIEAVLARLDERYAAMVAQVLGERVREDLALVDVSVASEAKDAECAGGAILAFEDGRPFDDGDTIDTDRRRVRPADLLRSRTRVQPQQAGRAL